MNRVTKRDAAAVASFYAQQSYGAGVLSAREAATVTLSRLYGQAYVLTYARNGERRRAPGASSSHGVGRSDYSDVTSLRESVAAVAMLAQAYSAVIGVRRCFDSVGSAVALAVTLANGAQLSGAVASFDDRSSEQRRCPAWNACDSLAYALEHGAPDELLSAELRAHYSAELAAAVALPESKRSAAVRAVALSIVETQRTELDDLLP